MSRTFGKIAALALGVTLVVVFVRSQRPHPAAPAAARATTTFDVRVVDVQERSIATQREILGTLEAATHAQLAARRMARVERVAVRSGDRVSRGDVLVELDRAEFASAVDRAVAELASAEQALDEARRELERTRALFERSARTQQELDRATTEQLAATARRDAANAALETARVALADMQLSAPFDGVVRARHVEPGDLARPGVTLLDLVDPSSLRLEARAPQSLLGRLAVGTSVDVSIDAFVDASGSVRHVVGRVEEVENEVDADTHTALVKVSFAIGDSALPGMSGRLAIDVGEKQALAVPRSAIVVRGQVELLFTLSNDGTRAVMHVVRAGRELADGEVELLVGPPGPVRVIVDGAAALSDGSTVHVLAPEAEPR